MRTPNPWRNLDVTEARISQVDELIFLHDFNGNKSKVFYSVFNLLQEHVHLFGGILSGQAKIAFEFEVFSLSYCSFVFFFFFRVVNRAFW